MFSEQKQWVVADGFEVSVIRAPFPAPHALGSRSNPCRVRFRPARVGIPAGASTFRFTALSPTRFSSRVSSSVSNQCSVDVSAAPRSQSFGDPMRRNVGRRLVLPPRIKRWSLTSLQQRLVKTGGRLVKHARYYWLLLAEGHLTRRLFGDMLRTIWALPVPAG